MLEPVNRGVVCENVGRFEQTELNKSSQKQGLVSVPRFLDAGPTAHLLKFLDPHFERESWIGECAVRKGACGKAIRIAGLSW